MDCAIKIFLCLFKQLWCLTKNVPIERIENGAIFTEGQGDTQLSVNANMQIRSPKFHTNQSRKIWHFGQHICVVLKVQTAYVSITSCLGSIVRCFQFFRVSSPSGKGDSCEPPTPLGNFCL